MRSPLLLLLALLCLGGCLQFTNAALRPTHLNAMRLLCASVGPAVSWTCLDNPCTWSGVSCDPQGSSVVRLNLDQRLYKSSEAAMAAVSALGNVILRPFERVGSVHGSFDTVKTTHTTNGLTRQVTRESSSPVNNASPTVPSSATPGPQTPGERNVTEVFPVAHCWFSRKVNTSTKTYALFGYDSTAKFSSGSEPIYNISGGFELNTPVFNYSEGIHPLTFAVEASSTIVALSFAGQFTPSSNSTTPAYFPDALTLALNTSNTEFRCPNNTLRFFVSYPSSTSSNLANHTRELYAEQIPYPLALLNVSVYSNSSNSSNSTNTRRASLAAGNLEVAMAPSETENPYLSYVLGIGAQGPPSDATTGESSGLPIVLSRVPLYGGEPTPDDLPPPPGLNAFAKGAIAICIIVGVLIVAVSIALACLSKDNTLPITSKQAQSKSVRVKKKRTKRDIESGKLLAPSTEETEHAHDEVVEHQKEALANEHAAESADAEASSEAPASEQISSKSSTK